MVLGNITDIEFIPAKQTSSLRSIHNSHEVKFLIQVRNSLMMRFP